MLFTAFVVSAHHTGIVGHITPSKKPLASISLNPNVKPQSEQQAHYLRMLAASERDFFWSAQQLPSDAALILIDLIEDLGLTPVGKLAPLATSDAAQFDYQLTQVLFDLINLGQPISQRGRSDNNDESETDVEGIVTDATDLDPEPDFSDVEFAFIDAARQYQLADFVNNALPKYQQIALLREAIDRYQNYSGEWTRVNKAFRPQYGQQHPQIKMIRDTLVLYGDLSEQENNADNTSPDVYDAVAVAAIKRFQQRNGLIVDGVAGPQTMTNLALSPQDILRRLQVNLQRWFLLPRQEPEHYVYVNIPQYQLRVIEEGESQLEMKVVVGKKGWPTPTMVSAIKEVTVNPTWTPTQSIVKRTLMPQYRRNPASLHHRGFHLVKKGNAKQTLRIGPGLPLQQMLGEYRLVQAAGRKNALGQFRFNIPNSQAIFLHDTPSKRAFNRHVRALSHGCIRLENARKFANYILTHDALYHANNNTAQVTSQSDMQFSTSDEQGAWVSTAEYNAVSADVERKLTRRVNRRSTQWVALKETIPTFIAYQTIWVRDNGSLQIFPDIYGLDGD
ncbi:L,D-transpeptidase family protein [Thalassotalea maritima]|uniref:L,D-transpeptidase family protein n=1 Tax=Thalassotalea maritima TaxID=3242416 RepID=UPI003526F718